MGDDRQSKALVRATPEDGKAIWDSIEARGDEPSDHEVARLINASGRFVAVNRSTVTRWRQKGWHSTRKRGDPLREMNKAVEVIKDIAPHVVAEAKEAIAIGLDHMNALVEKYANLGDANMMRAAARHCYANAMVLSREFQANAARLVAEDPVNAARMVKAIADSVRSANTAVEILVNMSEKLSHAMRTIDAYAVDNGSDAVAVDEDGGDYGGGIFDGYRTALPAVRPADEDQ